MINELPSINIAPLKTENGIYFCMGTSGKKYIAESVLQVILKKKREDLQEEQEKFREQKLQGIVALIQGKIDLINELLGEE